MQMPNRDAGCSRDSRESKAGVCQVLLNKSFDAMAKIWTADDVISLRGTYASREHVKISFDRRKSLFEAEHARFLVERRSQAKQRGTQTRSTRNPLD